jgi:hypothetical protein
MGGENWRWTEMSHNQVHGTVLVFWVLNIRVIAPTTWSNTTVIRLKDKINISKFISYVRRNALHLRYKDELFNTV